MLSPVCYPLFLLSIIRCCVAISDLGIQVGEPLPTLDAELNNFFLASESPDGTNTRKSSGLPLIQSNDQCRHNANQKSRKMRSKRGEVCSPNGEPDIDNGRSGTDEPPADRTPPTVSPVLQPYQDDNLCPPVARYPVCADPAAFPITPDALFRYQLSRMQIKYCRATAAPSCPNPGEEAWCCDFVFTSMSEFEAEPLLRIKYPDIGISCIEMSTGNSLAPESSP